MSTGLEGRTIESVRRMTADEIAGEFWDTSPHGGSAPALVLDDGTVLYPSTDLEGNGPGALFGDDGDEKFAVIPPKEAQ